MTRAELNARFRSHAKSLSPTGAERALAEALFSAVRSALGDNCFLIGSYARYTAATPFHDLDIIFLAGEFDRYDLRPAAALERIQRRLETNFRNPTRYRTEVSRQTHSVTVSFLANGEEQFGVDVVPAFTSGTKNEAGDEIFWVPEILKTGRRKRGSRYAELARVPRPEADWWVKSDPLGYIGAASRLNVSNPDFRKTAKIVKRWKHNCCEREDTFPLKSFHLEQAVFEIFRREPNVDVSSAVFSLFCDLPKIITKPQIRDRADDARFIDEYVSTLSSVQRQAVLESRDAFLIGLENISENPSMPVLLEAKRHRRAGNVEEYLFDSRIPVLLEPQAQLRVTGYVLPKDGFRSGPLDPTGAIQPDRKIRFTSELYGAHQADLFKWKVKNDDTCPQPRGEITDHQTRVNPESTRYKGTHYAECYAIKNRVCIARGRQMVVLSRGSS